MACLSVSLLGSLTVTLDGQPVNSFEYNKIRALLSDLNKFRRVFFILLLAAISIDPNIEIAPKINADDIK